MATQITPAELYKRIVSKQLPEYPPAAKAIRATGESVLEVVISEAGNVECVNLISVHRFLRAAITNSVKNWKFNESSTKYKGNIIIEGKSALFLNGKEVK